MAKNVCTNKSLIKAEINHYLELLRNAIAFNGRAHVPVYFAGVHKEAIEAIKEMGIKVEEKAGRWTTKFYAPKKGTKAWNTLFNGSKVLDEAKAYKEAKVAAAKAEKEEKAAKAKAKAEKKAAKEKEAKAEKKAAKEAAAKAEKSKKNATVKTAAAKAEKPKAEKKAKVAKAAAKVEKPKAEKKVAKAKAEPKAKVEEPKVEVTAPAATEEKA